MIEKLLHTIEKECKWVPGDLLVVGVSGGPDSLALLHGLVMLKVPVVAAHLNHGLRPEAEEDQLYVEQFATRLGVKFLANTVDTTGYARKNQLSLEEAGRELRYSFLFEQAEAVGAKFVAVGHHADDQVETVLMHLLRGAGLDGLSGMVYRRQTQWHRNIPLLRPLLGIWRGEIEAYCDKNELQPRFDRSNLDTTFYRNRIRHSLIPELKTYNPQITTGLWKMSNTLSEDRELLEESVRAQYPLVLDMEWEGGVQFMRTEFLQLPKAMQRRLIRKGVNRLWPDIRDVGYDEVEKVLGYVITPPKSGRADLFRGLGLLMEGDTFAILERENSLALPEGPQLAVDERLLLEKPGSVKSENGWQIRVELLSQRRYADVQLGNDDKGMCAFVDAQKMSFPVVVSGRGAGDRFCPMGMGGKSMKVSDFMINEKIPAVLRERWPLIYSGGEVIWVPGCRIADHVRVTNDTAEIVKLSIEG